MNYGRDDLDHARRMARGLDLMDRTRDYIRQKYKDNPEQFVSDLSAFSKGFTEIPRCQCGRRLIHTFGGYKCSVHGYV